MNSLRDVFICPFCKGHFAVLMDDSVAHTWPACEDFEKAEDTMDFVTKANNKIYGDAGELAELARLRKDD